ncbi:hypothetical protein TCON_1932 [Astathelohania contejeani]|uniref:Uncharacterized protein n=1 Tax=Astathelohania contejeani TaxID=164912 RepID=A0ABQ7HXE5_9MICR|nr:hypothetical protein TCON_1932 [Thelohania contejeani]
MRETPNLSAYKLYKLRERKRNTRALSEITHGDINIQTRIFALSSENGIIAFGSNESENISSYIEATDAPISDIIWISPHQLVFSSFPTGMCIYDVLAQNISLRIGDPVRCISHTKYPGIVTGDHDGYVRLWDIRMPTYHTQFQTGGVVTALAFNGKPNLYAATTPGCTILTWDLRYTQSRTEKPSPISRAAATSLVIGSHSLVALDTTGMLHKVDGEGQPIMKTRVGPEYQCNVGDIKHDTINGMLITSFYNQLTIVDELTFSRGDKAIVEGISGILSTSRIKDLSTDYRNCYNRYTNIDQSINTFTNTGTVITHNLEKDSGFINKSIFY